MWSVSFVPHGPVHIMIGGVWGANFHDFLHGIGYSSQKSMTIGLDWNIWQLLIMSHAQMWIQ